VLGQAAESRKEDEMNHDGYGCAMLEKLLVGLRPVR
jgi:hypothetical protein